MSRDPASRSTVTLSGLATARVALLRTAGAGARTHGGVAQAPALMLVPVHGDADGWRVVRSPLLPSRRTEFPVAVTDAALDFALRVDLLLRWIVPPVPTASPQRRPGEETALRVAFASPLAMLVIRAGSPTASDGDVAWWQAFGHACAIVGRRAATALAVTPAGVGAIPADRQVWRETG